MAVSSVGVSLPHGGACVQFCTFVQVAKTLADSFPLPHSYLFPRVSNMLCLVKERFTCLKSENKSLFVANNRQMPSGESHEQGNGGLWEFAFRIR